VTTDQILLGLGLTLVLAVGSQLVASRLRVPSIIVLLLVGFAAGAATPLVNPDNLLGATFQPLVSLAVAVILYDAGLSLDVRRLTGRPRRVVTRLVALGIPLTWAVGALVAGPLLRLSWGAAVMLGAILVVSGPTVVAPLLADGTDGPVNRVGQADPGVGVVVPYLEGEVLFRAELHRDALTARYAAGDRVTLGQAAPVSPVGEPLFVLRASGQLVPVTPARVPAPGPGDAAVVLTPAPVRIPGPRPAGPVTPPSAAPRGRTAD
jgi:Sodium/hydrogen exchanger family